MNVPLCAPTWGGDTRLGRSPTVLRGISLGPRARNNPATLTSSWSWDFLFPTIILHCTALQTPEPGACVWKWRQGDRRKQPEARCHTILNDQGNHCLSTCAYANWPKSYEYHMQMSFPLSKTVAYTCQRPLNQSAAICEFFIRIIYSILFNLALASLKLGGQGVGLPLPLS